MDTPDENALESSIQKHVGALDSGDLLRLRDELVALRESGGWKALNNLLSIEHQRLDRLAVARQREFPAGTLDELVRREGVRSHEAGMVAGLHKARRIIESVVDAAETVQAALERED